MASAVQKLTKNIQLLPVITRLRAFQRATDESHTLPLSPPKGGSETLLRCLTNKIVTLSIKFCYAFEYRHLIIGLMSS